MLCPREATEASSPCIIAIQCSNGLSDIAEDITLHQDLRAISRVNARVHVFKVRVIDVSGAEAETGRAAADVEPVVVVLRDVQVASVFVGIVVAVPDQRRFPVVVEICVGHRYPFRGVCDVD